MTNDPIHRLAAANPVPHAGPLQLPGPVRLRSGKALFAFAVGLVALACTGVAITATLGVWHRIRAANHPQTAEDLLPPKVIASVQQGCAAGLPYEPRCHLRLGTSRFVERLPDGQRVYVVKDARNRLCVLVPRGPLFCQQSLSRSIPLTEEGYGSPSGRMTMYGIVVNGVTAISFHQGGRKVTLPVNENVWVYDIPPGEKNYPGPLTVHFSDGTSVQVK